MKIRVLRKGNNFNVSGHMDYLIGRVWLANYNEITRQYDIVNHNPNAMRISDWGVRDEDCEMVSDLTPLYNIGDKVVPISKSIGIGFESSDWMECKEHEDNEGYIVVRSINEDLIYRCELGTMAPEQYTESDLIPYIEKVGPVKEKSGMKVFTSDYTVISEPVDYKTRTLILPLLISKGMNITTASRYHSSEVEKVYVFYRKDGHKIMVTDTYESNYKVVSLGDFLEMVINSKVPKKPIVFKKGDFYEEHEVTISEKGIKVGCQLLDFDNFERLAGEIAKFRLED